ncbi:type IV secretion system protein TraC [Arsenophonus sp. PmNCSU2021_1]|uniref:type IV secretion system protein TraC n=1 Tax=Arsenophonus sp. PmNCSU2021_1 TaxID=3118989 RepID=UPI002FEFE75C
MLKHVNPLKIIELVGNALMEKDTTRETAKKLESMDYPHLRDLLPYRDYDGDHQLFINQNSLGFLLEAQPLIGANEKLVESLEELVKNNLPRDIPLQVILLSSQTVYEKLTTGLRDFSWQGNRADECNQITQGFYLDAARHQFANPQNLPLTLRDYHLYFAFCQPFKRVTESEIIKIRETRRNLLSALNASDIHANNASITRFLQMMREMINLDTERLKPYSSEWIEDKDINQQIVQNNTCYWFKPGYVEITGRNEEDKPFSTRAIHFNLDSNPREHYLWQNGNIISNLLNPQNGIRCPFVMSFIIQTENQSRSQAEANKNFLSLEQKVVSSYAKYIPSTKRQHAEWKYLREGLLSTSTSLSGYYFGVTLFCRDDEEEAAKEAERTKKAFSMQGLNMVRADLMQMRNFLGHLPFAVGDNPKLWKDFLKTGAIQRAESFQAVNLMPIIADNKLSQAGIVFPSYRHQLAFLDIFDGSLPNTNFNWFASGTAGAGKSVLAQTIARQVLDSGGYLSIFDIGDSYKAFCQSVGGTYINGETLRFNPFANITDITLSAERIRDQLCILASPNGLMDEVHESLILEAITESWPDKKQDMRIDDVVAYLKNHRGKIQAASRITGRIDEILVLLNKYTTKGIYGKYFNSSEPTLKPDMRFVVTELGGLKANRDLLMAVLFTLMLWSENLMYNTPRSLRKMNIIDEGWKLLDAESPKVRAFIEEGYRTARKHNGSFGTVTQGIRDKNLSTASLACYDNSSFKFTMMQDVKAFTTFQKEEPSTFNEMEWALIQKFPPASRAGFSAVHLSVGGYSSFHRLMLDPLSNELFSSRGDDFTYREKRLKEGANINDIIFEMAQQKDPALLAKLKQVKP